MPKILNEEHLAKMKRGREEKAQESKGLIWRLGDDIEIRADRYQLILSITGEPEQYYHYSSLDEIIRDLLHKHAVKLMFKDERKNIIGVLECLNQTNSWLDEILTPALSPFAAQIKAKSLELDREASLLE